MPSPSDHMPGLKNVEQIAKLEGEQLERRTLSERIASAVTRAAGTATFAVGHMVWFAGWILLNVGMLRRVRPFDPFPFNLLTMLVARGDFPVDLDPHQPKPYERAS
jgi:uncharacterized membrane protein